MSLESEDFYGFSPIAVKSLRRRLNKINVYKERIEMLSKQLENPGKRKDSIESYVPEKVAHMTQCVGGAPGTSNGRIIDEKMSIDDEHGFIGFDTSDTSKTAETKNRSVDEEDGFLGFDISDNTSKTTDTKKLMRSILKEDAVLGDIWNKSSEEDFHGFPSSNTAVTIEKERIDYRSFYPMAYEDDEFLEAYARRTWSREHLDDSSPIILDRVQSASEVASPPLTTDDLHEVFHGFGPPPASVSSSTARIFSNRERYLSYLNELPSVEPTEQEGGFRGFSIGSNDHFADEEDSLYINNKDDLRFVIDIISRGHQDYYSHFIERFQTRVLEIAVDERIFRLVQKYKRKLAAGPGTRRCHLARILYSRRLRPRFSINIHNNL